MNIIDHTRVEHGLSFAAMARATGLNVPTVWRHCKGISRPDAKACAVYLLAFGLRLEDVRPDAFNTHPASTGTPPAHMRQPRDAAQQQ